MIPDDLRTTVYQLLAKTERGQVLWEPADTWGVSREGDFAFNGGKFLVALNRWSENYEDSPHSISLKFLNEKGVIAIECTVHQSELEDFRIMDRLYDLARRRALRADSILQDLTTMLESEEPIGKRAPPPKPTDDYSESGGDIPF